MKQNKRLLFPIFILFVFFLYVFDWGGGYLLSRIPNTLSVGKSFNIQGNPIRGFSVGGNLFLGDLEFFMTDRIQISGPFFSISEFIEVKNCLLKMDLNDFSIFNLAKNEFNLDLNKAKYFAGHSLGEYSALSCAGYLDFSDTLKILRIRGDAMQNSVPLGVGGMLAILGSSIDEIENVKVKASKVSGQKCQRCWKYEKELVKNEICNRCNDAIS